MARGLLIVFEGIDGTGKSTQLPLLAADLRRRGFQVVETREPTNGQYGRRIRELFTNRHQVTPEEELDLFLKDRREHVDRVIEPALAAGRIVLTDRYYFSTAAYQGAAGLDPQAVLAANRFAPEPDLVLLLTIPVQESLRRIRTLRGEVPNDFEQAGQLERVARLFTSFPHPCITRIDATGSVEQVRARIGRVVEPLVSGRADLRGV